MSASNETCAGSGGGMEALVQAALADCWVQLDGIIDKKQNILETNQKNDELESKLSVELKRNSELKQRLEQIHKSSSDYDNICSKLKSCLTVKDSDQSRLNHAQEVLNIGKEYTGIRWDFSAPPNRVKGYVKNNSKMLLECFNYDENEVDSATIADNLWKHVASAATTNWDDLVTSKVIDKKNLNNN